MTKLKIGGLYRHYKGNNYRMLALATHSETLEKLVVYEALYDHGGIWVRPMDMFCEDVTIDGVTQPRFRFIEE